MRFAIAMDDFETTRAIRRQRLVLKIGAGGFAVGLTGALIPVAVFAGVGALVLMDGMLWLATLGEHEFIFIGPWIPELFAVMAEVARIGGLVMLGALPVIGVGAILALPTRDIREWYTPEEIRTLVDSHNAMLSAPAWRPRLSVGPSRVAVRWAW